MILLLWGLLLSLIGSLPPGLISLLVAYTAIQKGLKAALWAALGAGIVEFGQAWLASSVAMWLLAHPLVEQWFQWGALFVFLGAGCYLLIWATPPRPQQTNVSQVSAWRQLGRGALVSLFNLLALPYWFAYCGWLKLNGWWPDNHFSVVFFSTGVGIGTLMALSLYAWAAQTMVDRSSQISLYANRAIGIIFLLLACKIMVNLY
jgi:threonine/homoserine/homoserine lactone efflux protein